MCKIYVIFNNLVARLKTSAIQDSYLKEYLLFVCVTENQSKNLNLTFKGAFHGIFGKETYFFTGCYLQE